MHHGLAAMMPAESLLIFGASTRAAAFSALRAGLRPWCADLFADIDLRACCAVVRVPGQDYPRAFAELVRQAPPGPFMYTGALENRPGLLRRIARTRRVWGNDADVLRRVRSPQHWHRLLRTARLPAPDIRKAAAELPASGKWLIKPHAGGSGIGIRFLDADAHGASERDYLQEYVEGVPCSASYVADGERCRLLGVTRQLVGEDWLQAAPFRYCGTIGPLQLSAPLQRAYEQIGAVLTSGCGLRGLFGVDCMLRDDVPWPVEVNPRYCASMEVLEHASGIKMLALHRMVFEDGALEPGANPPGECCVGKAILFARQSLTFPADGPWLASLRSRGLVHDLPAFADIPQAGEPIKKGCPILTFFSRAGSRAACQDCLRETAAALDHCLFEP